MANNYYNFPTPFVAGTKVRSDQMNTQLGGVESGFDKLPTDPVALIIGTAALGIEAQGATVNEFEVTTPDAQAAYADGQQVVFQATHTNTSVSTLNVDGLGAVNLVRSDGTSVDAGDLTSGLFYECRYDNANTRFQMMTVATSFVAAAQAAAVAAAASAAAALVSETNAGISETNAAASEAAALLSQDSAEAWAIRPEDDPVPIIFGGDGATTFSALHWAAKAAASSTPVAVGATASNTLRWDGATTWVDNPSFSMSGGGIGFMEGASQPRLDIRELGGSVPGLRLGYSTTAQFPYITMVGTETFHIQNGTFVQLDIATFSAAQVEMFAATVSVARTLGAAAGGFEVNNTLTGAGYERVLTASDLGGAAAQGTFTSANPIDLVDTDVALRVGAVDPDTTPHLELGFGVFGSAIQAKATDTTVDVLELNRLGGDVEIGSRNAAVAGGVNLNFSNGAAIGTVIEVTQSGMILEGMTGSNTILDFHAVAANLVMRQQFNGANLLFDGFQNSLEFQFQSRDSGGTIRQLLHMDPDNGLELYWGATGTIRGLTVATGFEVPGTLLDLNNSGAATAAELRVRNSEGGMKFVIDGGNFQLIQTTSAGVTEDEWISGLQNGAVALFNNNVSVARTVTAANGGLEANNTETGGGFERVLTESDIGGGGVSGWDYIGELLADVVRTSSTATVEITDLTVDDTIFPTDNTGTQVYLCRYWVDAFVSGGAGGARFGHRHLNVAHVSSPNGTHALYDATTSTAAVAIAGDFARGTVATAQTVTGFTLGGGLSNSKYELRSNFEINSNTQSGDEFRTFFGQDVSDVAASTFRRQAFVRWHHGVQQAT